MLDVLCHLNFLLRMNHMHEFKMRTNQGQGDEIILQCFSQHFSSEDRPVFTDRYTTSKM